MLQTKIKQKDYTELRKELVRFRLSKTIDAFNQIVIDVNKFDIYLSDDDFKRLFELGMKDVDTTWIIHKMASFDMELVDALVLYITY